MSVATAGRGQHTRTSRNDALDRLSGLRVFDEWRVFNALFDLVAPGFLAPFRDGLVDVNRHTEVMSGRWAMARNFLSDGPRRVEFTCQAPNVASQLFSAIGVLPWS
jgi:hypothetical protein